jgi:hypothetical protein
MFIKGEPAEKNHGFDRAGALGVLRDSLPSRETELFLCAFMLQRSLR